MKTEKEITAFRHGLEFMIVFVEETAEKFYEKDMPEYGTALEAFADGTKDYVTDFTNLYAALGYEGMCNKCKEDVR